MSDNFAIRSIPFLFMSARNLKMVAGHVRIFGDRPGKGFTIYTYNQLLPAWALERCWNFGLFCIHHIGEGDSTNPPGWHITWAKLTAKREHGGFSIRWHLADKYSCKKNR